MHSQVTLTARLLHMKLTLKADWQVHLSGIPAWDCLRGLRLACATPEERRINGHHAVAGTAISIESDIRSDYARL